MSPVFTRELTPDTQSQLSTLAASQSVQGAGEANRLVRASFTVIGLALSFGVADSLLSSAKAADSMQLAALPSVTGAPGTLPSFGSDRSAGAASTYHTVVEGETIWDIAKRHGVSVEDIKASNSIAEDQVIQVGQVLKVPPVTLAAASLDIQLNSQAATIERLSEASVLQQPQGDTPDKAVEQEPTHSVSLSEFLGEQAIEGTSPEVSPVDQEAIALAAPAVTELDTIPEAESMAALPQLDATVSATQSDFSEKLAAKRDGSTELPLQPTTSSVGDSRTHRVGSGETIWTIARLYDVEPELLQASNDISNPNFIVTGDELVIPESAATLTVDSDPDIERLTRLQRDTARQMTAISQEREATRSESPSVTQSLTVSNNVGGLQESIESSESLKLDDAIVGLQSQPLTEQGTAQPEADPFVAGLLSEVATATQTQVELTATTANRYSAERFSNESFGESVSQSTDSLTAATDDSGSLAVNPQFADSTATTNLDEATLPTEELLAAAPLGSEVYAPVIENPEGRVVSPDMPVLPGQDEYLPEAPNRFDGYIWPAQGVLTSGYGWRWGRMHRGVDIAGPVGTPIYAAGPGVVVKSGWNSGGYGNLVDIRHPDGSMTRYAHNSRLLVSEGQQVRQGQQIAEMGSTGYSTGPHLHFEVHIPSQGTVNPIAMLPGR